MRLRDTNLVTIVAVTLIVASLVFLLSNPELTALGSADRPMSRVGDVVEYQGHEYRVEEVLHWHKVPQYRLRDGATGHDTLIPYHRIDGTSPPSLD